MPTTDELQAQINALQQQLNQIIGMSNDDYVLTYSGEEVDDLLAKASAAAAYGYGGALPVIDINNDETAFNAAVDALLDEMPNYTMRQLRYANYPVGGQQGPIFAGALYRHNASYAYLRGSSYGGGTIQKCKSAGAWTPWEWVNPPLVLGVEYRTTERYLGKPVYAKAVNFGALPNNGRKQVDFSETPCNVISVSGNAVTYGNNYLIPSSTINIVKMYANSTTIFIVTENDQSNATATFILKYTKTTG